MLEPCKFSPIFGENPWRILIGLAVCLLFTGIVAGQDLPVAPSRPDLLLPATSGVPLKITFPSISDIKVGRYRVAGQLFWRKQ
jgi:hypothetical protein